MARNSVTVWKEVEVDVDIQDFDNEDLISTLENRGYTILEKADMNRLYNLYRDYIQMGMTEIGRAHV